MIEILIILLRVPETKYIIYVDPQRILEYVPWTTKWSLYLLLHATKLKKIRVEFIFFITQLNYISLKIKRIHVDK